MLARAFAWDTAIKQSIEPPHPRFPLVFSAFSVGLFANAVLPGRVGELARVAVLRRRLAGRKGTTATLVGSVFAHRIFDLFPAVALVTWVLLRGEDPALGAHVDRDRARDRAGDVLRPRSSSRGGKGARATRSAGSARCSFARARGSRSCARRSPRRQPPASSSLGWICQLFAVWAAMEAFGIHLPIAAAGLVLVLMNVATIFPLWPGNFGLVQIAVAFPLTNYGVEYAHGVAFGIGLQAIEASVGVGVGLIFLAREGLSYATLRDIDDTPRANGEDTLETEAVDDRARVAG